MRIWALVFPVWRFFRSQNPVKISWNSKNCDYYSVIAKCDSLFHYKVRWSVAIKCDNFITNCIRYCKKRRLLQSATEHSMNGLLTYLSRTYILHIFHGLQCTKIVIPHYASYQFIALVFLTLNFNISPALVWSLL